MTEVLTKALLHVDSITDDRTRSTDICAASSYHQNSGSYGYSLNNQRANAMPYFLKT